MQWRRSHYTTDLTVCDRTQIRLKLRHSIYRTKRENIVQSQMEQYRTREHAPGVTLDRTLSYKQHIYNRKMKVVTRNNLLRKLANWKWGPSSSTMRTTALDLCYSVAENAALIWARSHYAHVLNSELNTACRAISGCLEDLYLLAGITPLDTRRDVCARVEKKNRNQT